MRRLFAGLRPPPELTDCHLLDRFRLHRDEGAFAELVRRHGPLVWGVCRRTLAPVDAEDAFQATFLLLLRRAAGLTPADSLAPWLYRVAVLTARTARRAERRRWFRVRVGLPAAVLAVAGACLLPAGLEASAVRAGGLYLAGGAVPPAVASLTRGVLTMGVLKSVTAAGLLCVAVAGAGVGVGLRAGPDDKPAAGSDTQAVAKAQAALAEAEAERRKLEVETAAKHAEAEARVAAARASLAAVRDRAANSLVLTDSAAGFAGRYKLHEPAAGAELTYLATTEAGLVKLLTRTRAAVPDQPLRVEVEPHQHEAIGARLAWLCKQAGYTTVQYSGPPWVNFRALVVPPLRVFKRPKYDESTLMLGDHMRAAQAASSGQPVEPRPDNPEVDMVGGQLDLANWK